MAIKTGEHLFEFSKAVMTAADQNEVWESLKATLSKFGVQFVNYAYGKPDDLLFFTNMSAEWLSYYSEHYAATDYLVEYCIDAERNLLLDASHFKGEGSVDRTNTNMMSDVWDQGARGGIFVPVPKPGREFLAGAGIFFGLSEVDSADVMVRHGEEIALIMHAAHQFISGHELQIGPDVFSTSHNQNLENRELLTDREKDILRYLALGLRPDRIAEKMQLQLATIYMHISKARRRLGAATREQAISIAMSKRHLII